MSNKKLEFIRDDFHVYGWTGIDAGSAVKVAQARFDAWLSEQVRVYGRQDSDGYWFISNNQPAINVDLPDTHTALLVCIEEIQKKVCEHRPFVEYDSRFGMTLGSIPECKDCGVKLKMPTKWEEA